MEVFEKRIEAYDRMAEKHHAKNHEFQRRMKQKYRFEKNDSINSLFNSLHFYDSNDINKHIQRFQEKFKHMQFYDAYNEKGRVSMQFNEIMMSIDTAFRHYEFWRGDSINNFFIVFQFSDTTDIDIYIQRFQEQFRNLQFRDTVNGKHRNHR
jgi:hypothetical protein